MPPFSAKQALRRGGCSVTSNINGTARRSARIRLHSVTGVHRGVREGTRCVRPDVVPCVFVGVPAWPVGAAWSPPVSSGLAGCGSCDNTPSQPHPVGGKASQTVPSCIPAGEYLPRKETPKSTHTRRRPEEGSRSEKHEFCDRKFTCPGRGLQGGPHASPSYTPLGPLPDGPPARPPSNRPRKPPHHMLPPQGPRDQTLGRAQKLLEPPYGRALSVDT